MQSVNWGMFEYNRVFRGTVWEPLVKGTRIKGFRLKGAGCTATVSRVYHRWHFKVHVTGPSQVVESHKEEHMRASIQVDGHADDELVAMERCLAILDYYAADYSTAGDG